jgi:hypothetical protein
MDVVRAAAGAQPVAEQRAHRVEVTGIAKWPRDWLR